MSTKFKIRDIEFKNNIVLAPMAGITNQAFRTIARDFDIGLVYGEMVSDKAINHKNALTLEMTQVSKEDHPIAMQLFGSDVDSLTKAAIYLDQETDCDIIDFNMGCPVNKVVKTGAGSALMKTPELAYNILKSIVDHVDKPVTVKIRAGWDLESVNAVEIAKLAEKAGVEAIAVHPRTRSQMYEGHSNWSIIKDVKEAVTIPVIGNGDIKSYEDAKQMLEETGCDAIMIGRAAFGNPWVIEEINNGFAGKPTMSQNLDDKKRYILKHMSELISLKGEMIAIREMRGHACWYINGLPHNNKVKSIINRLETEQQLESLVQDYFDLLENDRDYVNEHIEELLDKHSKFN